MRRGINCQLQLTCSDRQSRLTFMPDLSVLASAAAGKDPREGLSAVVALRRLLERLEYLHVKRAREQGDSWQQIAEWLGVTRQAAHKKHGAAVARSRRDRSCSNAFPRPPGRS